MQVVIEEELKYLNPVIDSAAEPTEYYFESDSLALKENEDYQLLMKTLVKLESQKMQAIKDYENLQEIRDRVLKDPIAFVASLQSGENLGLPSPIAIAEVPDIDWEKYNVTSIIQGMRPNTRKRLLQENDKLSEFQDTSLDDSTDTKLMVRGRMYDSTKPQTFNQTWTQEEQQKLEELLIKYPDERIASRRWTKISKELGTRTPLQVQSRVQKYFIALKKQGLPVPGRMPSKAVMKVKVRKRTNNTSLLPYASKSSFCNAFSTDQDDEEDDIAAQQEIEPLLVSDEEDIAEELRSTDEYRELLQLKRAKYLKLKEIETGQVEHLDFTCDGCGVWPIVGTRYHCQMCPTQSSVDLCASCAKAGYTNADHSTSHTLQPIRSFCIKDSFG